MFCANCVGSDGLGCSGVVALVIAIGLGENGEGFAPGGNGALPKSE